MKYSAADPSPALRLLALACGAALACTPADTGPRGDRGEARTIETRAQVTVELGPRQTLLGNGAFGLRYFPDQTVVRLDRRPLYRLLVTATDTTYVLEGPDIQSLERPTPVLRPGPSGAFDNGYAGIAGVYRSPGGALYGFYHAEDQEGLPRLPSTAPGFYASIGAAVSSDGGTTWRKLGPVITSAKPKSWTARADHGDRGAGIPSFVVDRDGQYLFAYYTEHSYVDDRGPPICLARADLRAGAPVPGRWRKHHQGAFGEPGLGGLDTPILPPTAGQPSVVFSPALDRYVMVMIGIWWREMHEDPPGTERPLALPLEKSGLYIAFSADGLAWSDPEPLLVDYSLPRLGRSLSWMPSVLFDEGSSSEGWLVYAYSPRWGHRPGEQPHFMVGRRIRLHAAENTTGPGARPAEIGLAGRR